MADGGRRLLVVDDERIQRLIVTRAVESVGFTADGAAWRQPPAQAAFCAAAKPATSACAAASSGPVTTSLAQPNASHMRAE